MALTPEQQVDAEDWESFRRAERMTDHWWWRPGWRPDRHYLTWYLVFQDPALADYVAGFQRTLADLGYLDPVPVDGLHLTVQGVAFADEMDADQVAALGKAADELCADLERFTLTAGPIAAYTGGTFLRTAPWQPVAELRERLRSAIGQVLGTDAVPDEPAMFKPHISVTYGNADPPAAEVIHRLTKLRQQPPISLPATSVDLLELRRDGHAYRWDIRHHIDFTA
ncbi:conserved hypothetical protein [Frankia canadensis]|uniref:2'-5' RNA ligase n=1 Tax=Frankia canadensis TaxID=1836972 RepID=A0A2I2KNK8_9ACTN|nr:2'-5' RNA ligase family protein [Frankia canadensis]SNQ47248.1 conserved hypothetical protein [Frankia canadensis]SOU54538.1 conserved hypothetical protein [Frankia canadensis]